MKTEKVYVFYGDEDVASELKEHLNIRPAKERNEDVGSFEIENSLIVEQLKEFKWSDIGIGRYGMVFYLNITQADDDNPIPTMSIEKAHIIVRHKTKAEIKEESKDGIQKALTLLDATDTI